MTVALEPSRSLTFRAGALLVRGAGAMVPPRRRSEWRREWEAELWYAVAAPGRGGRLSLADRLGLVARCLGAYQHAAWLCARQLRHRRLRVRVGVAVRDLRAEPRPGILALTSVALTVGAAGILFGLAEQARHRILPAPGGERIVRVFNSAPAADLDRTGISGFELARFRARSRSFRGSPPSASFRRRWASAPRGSPPSSFPCCKVTPASGRDFVAADYESGAKPVALVREDAGLRLGATLVVEGVRHTVVGTLPAGLRFPRSDTRAWIPFTADSGLDALGERNVRRDRQASRRHLRGRRERELTARQPALQSEHPEGYLGPFGVSVEHRRRAGRGGRGRLGAHGRRAACRRGIDRGRGIRCGCRVRQPPDGDGLGGSCRGRRLIGWAIATLGLNGLRPVGVASDGIGVTAFAATSTVAAVAASLLLGLTRRRRATGSRSAPGLALHGRVGRAPGLGPRHDGGYRQLARRGPGFDPVGLFALRAPNGVGNVVAARVARVPGVEGVALTSEIPVLESAPAATFEIAGAVVGRGPAPSAEIQVVGANYFTVARIPLLAGRTFAAASTDRPPTEVVVNRTLAARFFGDGAPIGRRLVAISARAGRAAG